MTITTKISKGQINADSTFLIRRFRDNAFQYLTALIELHDTILFDYDRVKLNEIETNLYMLGKELKEIQTLLGSRHNIKAKFDIEY